MKQILIILGLFASVTTFAQSPRIKLNQITKDTVKGSVLISSPSDSGMVYSRDFYVAYGADTVLILYGDTLAATSGIISSVLSDGVTITGNGTSGDELKVDTSLIATIKALNDSLATISASTTPDNVTITGDGSVGNPLKVDTATVISTIKGLVDTLSARGYLTANQTITLSGDVTGSGTTSITATVVDDSHDHIISNVDFLQDSLNAKANDSDLANYVTLSGADTITGAKTFTNTFTQSGGDANFDSGTLYVDESENRVGIGTSTPTQPLDIVTGANEGIVFGSTSNSTAKEGGLLMRHYNTAEEDVLGFYAATGTNYNNIFFGGGASGLNAATGIYFYTAANNTTTSGTERIRIKSDGEVIVGATDRGAYNLQCNGTGVWGQGAYVNGSDIKLKTNIESISNSLNKILKLNPVKYNYKSEYTSDTSPQLGFIAQEVVSALDSDADAVVKDNGDILSMAYQNLIPLLTKAIQEQQEQIETIQTELDAKSLIIETQATEINQLKTLITDLTNRIQILENK